jgi:hypothetical protein
MLRSLVIISVLTIGLAMPAMAQQKSNLPKSGSFNLHTGFKAISEATQVEDKHTLGSGKSWGVTYNDAGSGPLHLATIVCAWFNEAIDGAGTSQGKCAWSDPDGDKIFADYSGKFSPTSPLAGEATIISGQASSPASRPKAPSSARF